MWQYGWWPGKPTVSSVEHLALSINLGYPNHPKCLYSASIDDQWSWILERCIVCLVMLSYIDDPQKWCTPNPNQRSPPRDNALVGLRTPCTPSWAWPVSWRRVGSLQRVVSLAPAASVYFLAAKTWALRQKTQENMYAKAVESHMFHMFARLIGTLGNDWAASLEGRASWSISDNTSTFVVIMRVSMPAMVTIIGWKLASIVNDNICHDLWWICWGLSIFTYHEAQQSKSLWPAIIRNDHCNLWLSRSSILEDPFMILNHCSWQKTQQSLDQPDVSFFTTTIIMDP